MTEQTHEIIVRKPKPAAEEVLRLTSAYFDAKGREYDKFEKNTPKRDLFTERVNQIIAARYSTDPAIEEILSIACGTGRREHDIQDLTGRSLQIVGVEISGEMCRLAAERGIEVHQGSWLNIPPLGRSFDSALILSAFGHVPTPVDRRRFLRKVAEHLKEDAPLFLDVLNIEDRTEWGPRIDEIFAREDLSSHGFERGDVLYRKIGEQEICFYHYFSTDEIRQLLNESGFRIESLWYIGYGDSFGEIKTSPSEGAIFIEARRRE